MKTLLVFPPQAHPTQPALSLPSLVAWLRQEGFADTHQRDLNLEAHEYYLSRDRLVESRSRVSAAFEELPRGEPLPLADMDRFRVLSEAYASADAVVEGIDDAKALLRDSDRFYDYDQYLSAVKVFDRAFRLISAEHYPSVLTPHNFTLKYSIEREEEILAALGDPSANFFLEYYEKRALPEILEASPDLLGISLTYTSQVIPGLALAAMVKKHRPDIHITIGGGLLAYIGDKMTRSGRVFDAIDSVILLEGEAPLLKLAQCIDQCLPIDEVPNCVHRKDGEVVTNCSSSPVDIDSLPTPEFDGLPMRGYFSPKLALPLAITRGCYWEKCAFCTLYKVIGPGYRQRSLEKVMDDIETVTTKWDSDVVYFIVEDMPPVLFRKLPPALKERQLKIHWWTDARLERNLFSPELCRDVYESGCRRIAFGFESGSQRLLDLMEKGTCLDEADTILRNLKQAGVSVTLYTMIGFPTETVEEARSTLAWLQERKDLVQEVSLRIFYIDHLSKVYGKPEDYDVREILHDEDKDLQVYYDWVPGAGMTRREARELFFDFMKVIREEFPLFHEDNLLLFELKSHYFLYLTHYGDLGFLQDKSRVAVEEAVPEDLGAAVVSAPTGNKVLSMGYDLKQVSDTLNEAECSILRPRYMSGNFKEGMLRELESKLEPAPPQETWVAYRAKSADLLHVGKDAAKILAAFDGRRTVGEVLSRWPERLQPKLMDFVRGLFRQGLLRSAAGANPQACEDGVGPEGVLSGGETSELEVTRVGADDARSAETMHLYCRPSVS